MSRSLLERVEELAALRYGKGAAVSVDREKHPGHVRMQTRVRVWDAKGTKVFESAACDMKYEAVREALRGLMILEGV